MQTMTGWMRRFVVFGILAQAAFALPFTANGRIEQFFSGGGNPPPGTPTLGPTGASWIQSFDNIAGLSAESFAISGAGNLQTLAIVNMSWAGWASGSISSRAHASLRETVLLDWEAAAAHAWEPGTAHLIMRFAVNVSGLAVAASNGGDNSGASVDYTATIGDATASGSKGASAGGSSSTTGTWGTVLLDATVPWQSNLYVDLSANSYASAGKTYLSFPTATAMADFSHTLRWGGLQQIFAVDGQGVRREVAGAYIPLIGQETGFNYFYGVAQAENSGVPEPASMLLLGAGLLGVWWRRAR